MVKGYFRQNRSGKKQHYRQKVLKIRNYRQNLIDKGRIVKRLIGEAHGAIEGAVCMSKEIFVKATIVKTFWTSAIFVKKPTLPIKDLFYNAILPINFLFYNAIFPINGFFTRRFSL